MTGLRARTIGLLLLALAAAGAAGAGEEPRRPVTGRTAAAVKDEPRGARDSGWCLGLTSGLLAGGDLFQVATDLTVPWTPPAGGATFNAKRFTVTLDEAAAFGLTASRRLTSRGWLRLDLAVGRMDAAALANDSQFVTPVLYDRWNVTQLAASWEQRLTDTRLQPLLLAGASLTGIGATAAASDQTVAGLRLGAGMLFRGGPRWSFGLDVADHVQQFVQDGLAEEMGFPPDARYREFGPQHLVTITGRLLAHF